MRTPSFTRSRTRTLLHGHAQEFTRNFVTLTGSRAVNLDVLLYSAEEREARAFRRFLRTSHRAP